MTLQCDLHSGLEIFLNQTFRKHSLDMVTVNCKHVECIMGENWFSFLYLSLTTVHIAIDTNVGLHREEHVQLQTPLGTKQ